MSVPVWVLLGFAGWTLAVLLGTIGVYRWSRILTGRQQIKEFRAEAPEGRDWYKRSMRAHANCIENLPVYGAIVLAIEVAGVRSPVLDTLAIGVLVARVFQSTVHIAFEQTNTVVAFRFAFFLVQLLCMIAMGVLVAAGALGG